MSQTVANLGSAIKKRYNIPQISLPKLDANLAPRAAQTSRQPEENKVQEAPKVKGMNDFLLEEFSEEQREYLIEELYPSLK